MISGIVRAIVADGLGVGPTMGCVARVSAGVCVTVAALHPASEKPCVRIKAINQPHFRICNGALVLQWLSSADRNAARSLWDTTVATVDENRFCRLQAASILGRRNP